MLLFQNFQPTYLVDLAEFATLDPTFKRFYKQYFVDIVLKAYLERYNSYMIAGGRAQYLLNNEASIKKQCISIAQQLQDVRDGDAELLLSAVPAFFGFTSNDVPGAAGDIEEGFQVPKLREMHTVVNDMYNMLRAVVGVQTESS